MNDEFYDACDFYGLRWATVSVKGLRIKTAYFDVFFRNVPDQGGFAIAAGLQQVIEYIENLHFTNEDLDFLRSKGVFHEPFLRYLADFKFSGDIYAIPEGTPIFPGEPILTVRAKAMEAQLIETYLLMAINHQSMIATKANRIVRAAQGRTVLEFGARRAHGTGGAVEGARAAYIGERGHVGCAYRLPVRRTLGRNHGAFLGPDVLRANRCVQGLLHDLPKMRFYWSTVRYAACGIPNAIRVFKEVLIPKGIKNLCKSGWIRRPGLPIQKSAGNAG